MKRALAFALLAGSAGPAAAAQLPPSPGAPPQGSAAQNSLSPELRSQSTVVLVPALVRDVRGKLVYTLKADDFRLTDNGVEQKLTLDENVGSEPVALVVAIQNGGAGARKLDDYRDLSGLLAAIVGGVPHQIAVVAFDSTPHLAMDFTSDTDAAAAALKDLKPGDRGAAILDALEFSVDRLRPMPAYRRTILLVSETLDHGSQTKIGDALRAIGDTNTAIYSVAFSSLKAHTAHEAERMIHDDTPGPDHGCFAKDPDADAHEVSENRAMQDFDCLGLLAPPLRLAKLAAVATAESLHRNVPETVAQLTGGEYFGFENSRNLVRDLVTISNHVPNRYGLSFQPKSPQAGYHSIELRLKGHPDLHVSARHGYWADEETGAASR
jgi:VWFA-related protein